MRAARSMFVLTAGLLLAAAPGIGSAQGWRPAESRDLLTPYGEYLLLGGGVTDFTKDATKDRFDTGGTWDVRLGFGSNYYVGAEAAYVGAALSSKGAGPDLRMNGVEGVIRVQYPYVTSGWLVEPFAFGGLGYSHLSLKSAAPGLKDSDDIGVVPFGAGVTVGYNRFLVDARFTYRTTFNEDLVLGPSQSAANLERWSVGASIGYEF
jgi:hypothetical protein